MPGVGKDGYTMTFCPRPKYHLKVEFSRPFPRDCVQSQFQPHWRLLPMLESQTHSCAPPLPRPWGLHTPQHIQSLPPSFPPFCFLSLPPWQLLDIGERVSPCRCWRGAEVHKEARAEGQACPLMGQHFWKQTGASIFMFASMGMGPAV